jgi:hypothetical protein
MFTTTLEVEKQLQQVIKQLYEKVGSQSKSSRMKTDRQATTSVIV